MNGKKADVWFRAVPFGRTRRGTKMGKKADYRFRLFQARVFALKQKWAKTPIFVQACSIRAVRQLNKNRSFSGFLPFCPAYEKNTGFHLTLIFSTGRA